METTVETLNYTLTNSSESPATVNYNNSELVERSLYTDGDLARVEFYRSFNPETGEFSGLAVAESYTYKRDPFDVAIIFHACQVAWYLEDETVGESITKSKIYDPAEGVVAQERKRWNLINQAKAFMLMNIGYLNSAELLNEIEAAGVVRLYVQEIKNPLYDFLREVKKEYVTEEVRQGLLKLLEVK
jgi:hypothetical protein